MGLALRLTRGLIQGPLKEGTKGAARYLRIEQATEKAEGGIENEHRLERGEARHTDRHQKIRAARRQRAGGGGESADQA
jgi:hypothetical protein